MHEATQVDLSWVDELPANLTISEFAKVTRTSIKTVRRRIKAGLVRATRLRTAGSSRVLIPRSELRRFLQEATT